MKTSRISRLVLGTLYITLLAVLVVPHISFAAVAFEPLTALPGIKDAASASTLPNFLNTIYKICIGAASVIAVIMIMVAGVEFMTSGGSFSTNQKAKDRLRNALVGLLLVLSPTIVFGIINPSILNLDFTKDLQGLQQTKPLDTVTGGVTNTSGQPTTQQQCTVQYDPIKSVSGSCDSSQGFTSISAVCCSANGGSGTTCCGKSKTAQQYLYAGYFIKKNNATQKSCYVSSVGTSDSSQTCNTQVTSFKNIFTAQSSSQSTYSGLTIVKSCELVTAGSTYTLPPPSSLPICAN